uniref:Gamma-aminobutyric acid receptor subunit beta n=1 Tax=Daphnia galeata TaxID=27404 RepID=A0A8J2S307_9CRUS|nr:unnamed protein product [Daphnia galeata]
MKLSLMIALLDVVFGLVFLLIFGDFTLDVYFRQYWTDDRLSFQRQRGVEILSVSTEYLRNMWVPDTFFPNEKTAYLHTVTTSNEFVRIRHDGEISRSMRITITASCPMNLKYFPLDSQLCPVEIESFGFTTNEIWYKWVDGPKAVSIFPEVELPQFQVMGYRKREYSYSLTTGNYSRLACDIQFVRSMGFYLIQIYIPSSLIVVISWVSFWINRNAAPARVSLGVTTVLTMTTLMSSTNAQLPKISYVKSIDIYLGTCFVMVFASLLEYAAVGYIAKRIEMRKKRYQNLQKLAEQRRAAMQASTNAGSSGLDGETASSTVAKSHCKNNKSGSSTVVQVTAVADTDDLALVSQGKNLNVMMGASPSTIDKYSRVIFPVCFTCFHLMYWVIYLHVSEVDTKDLTLHNPK